MQDKIQCNCYDFTAFFIKEDRPSAHNRNRYGESGLPCFIPRDGVMYPFASPFMSTEYDVVWIVSMAKHTHRSSIPNSSIICWRNSHSTWSYVLLISSLIATCLFFLVLLFLILCKNSKVTVLLSLINRLETKALCEPDITFGRISINL